MGRIEAVGHLEQLEVGDEYTRQEIAKTIGLPVPHVVYGTAWADGILELKNAVLLFVTLKKEDEVTYLDFFEGRNFVWESQNRQTQRSPVIKKIAEGFPTHLFARVRAKIAGTSNAMPFVYCGELGILSMTDEKPVTCLFKSIDYSEETNGALDALYNWRPDVVTKSFEARRERLAGDDANSPTGKTSAKYWRVANAVEALGRASVAEVDAWLADHHPEDNRSDLRENLAHLTVNAPSRVHYDKARKDWRSSTGHERDRLFQISSRPPTYEPYDPRAHGYVDIQLDADGKWRVEELKLGELEAAESMARLMAAQGIPVFDKEHDARVWILRMIARRQGQPAFRSRVLAAYDGRCCISGFSTQAVLEAAHIRPYKGLHTNAVDNALLLRSDLHALFDLGLLWIDEAQLVRLSPLLDASEYWEFEGQPLRLPRRLADRPSAEHLAAHAALAIERSR